MRRVFNILIIALLLGGGAGYVLFGPSFFLGGPKTSDIVAVTRATMVATAPSPADADKARAAKITPKGICSSDNGVQACIVEVEIDGAPATTFVATMTKSANGWVAAQ